MPKPAKVKASKVKSAAAKPAATPKLRRVFITPEGVDLSLELAGAGARAGAFMIDAVIIIVTLIVGTILLMMLAWAGIHIASATMGIGILWLLSCFVLRNFWFVLFEMGGRGATPGKRLMGLRVVARDGARLTGGAVLARNALREIEVFLPLTFLFLLQAQNAVDAFTLLAGLCWSGVFLLFPLFNRDRLRVGDLVAGTWVVHDVRAGLGTDLGQQTAGQTRRHFSDAALSLYGIYELQTLETVLRQAQPNAIAQVAASIRTKARLANDGDDAGFLADYYAALCRKLEQDVLVGRRRENKHR